MSGDNDTADPIHRAVAEQIGQLLVADRAVRADADDAIHQLRVTIRRLRSLLQASPNTFADGASLGDELRWLAGLLGTARDAEVLAQRYRRELDVLPPQLVRGRVRERLVDTTVQRYRAGRAHSLVAMRSPRYFRLLERLDALVADSRADAVGDRISAAPETVDAAYRRLTKAVKAARRSDSDRDEALHRIRKAAKRLRYTAEATGARRVATRAKSVQVLLGDHQDSVVSRAHLLLEAAAAHAAGEDTFSYGLLYQQEEDLARSCRTRLDHALDELTDVCRYGRFGR